ncbi:hypothetical protein AKO1_005879 [Acrasis kona]|uniref:Gustatory receptor n=1 Tax=Acrasis kona TaxID=1008807 RepID=A0AAW2YIY4_9EUKA
MTPDEELYFHIAWILLIIIYSVFIVGTVACLVYPSRFFTSQSTEFDMAIRPSLPQRRTSKIVVTFRFFLLLCLALRLVYFVISFVGPNYWMNDENEPGNRILPDTISMMFYCSQAILITYWCAILKRVRIKHRNGHNAELSTESFARLFLKVIAVCLFLVTLLVVLFVVLKYAVSGSYIEKYEIYKWVIECIYFPLVTFLTSTLFVLLSWKMHTELIMTAMRSSPFHQQLKDIGLFVRLCTNFHFFKSIFNVVILIPQVRSWFGPRHYFYELIYFSIFEILLHIVILIVLSRKSISSPLLPDELPVLAEGVSDISFETQDEVQDAAGATKLYNDVSM